MDTTETRGMDITKALEAALAEVKAAIPVAQTEAEKAARHVAALLDEERGLQLALARRTTPAAVTNTNTTVRTGGVDAVLIAPPAEAPAPEAAPAKPPGDWASLNHMEAALRALNEAKRPLSPKDIVRALRAVGRSDSNDQVRAALAALKRRGHVSLQARAQWVATVDWSSGTQSKLVVSPAEDTETYVANTDEAAPVQADRPIQLPRLPELNGLASNPAEEVVR